MNLASVKCSGGEHRLESIIESGILQLFVVVSGVNPDVYDTYDTYGKKRSTGDHLYVRGEKNPKILADALNSARAAS
jgi:hypothetical protein